MAEGDKPAAAKTQLKELGFWSRAAVAIKTAQLVIQGVDNNTWMSPLNPLAPYMPYVEGRQWDYNAGYNINYIPRGRNAGRASFAELRNLSINCELARLVIETRKDQVCALHWQITPIDKDAEKDSDEDPTIKELTEFFQSPDKANDWDDWLRIILEELFVTDAVALYKYPTKGGGLYALEHIDGTTIFPLIDAAGRRPKAPNPAFQQVLKGVPKINYSTDELIYKPRNLRVYSPYGFSPLEQVIISCRMDIERAKLQLAYFTEGATPDTFMTMDKDIPLESVRSWERNFNDLMAGNSAERRRVPFLPAGTKAEPLKPPPLKDEFDEWIARKVCFAFSIPPNAFTKQMNRASAESEHDRALEEGLEPIKKWVKKLIDNVIKNDMKIEGYEFAWRDDREQDAEVQDNIVVNDTKAGIISINEARDAKGLDPLGGDFDTPMVLTANGYVPITAYQDGQEQKQQQLDTAQTAAENPPEPSGDDIVTSNASQNNGNKAQNNKARVAMLGAPATPKIAFGVASPAARKAVYSKVSKAVSHPAIPFSRPTTEEAVAVLAGKITPILKKTGGSVAKQLKEQLSGFKKADDDEPPSDKTPEEIAASLDLSVMDALADVTPPEMQAIAQEAGLNAILQIGVGEDQSIVNVVDAKTQAYAKARGAEMIGKKWVGDELVDNPNAVWRIDETTRDQVKDAINKLYAGEIDHTEFFQTIQDIDAFTATRANMIARTEIITANAQGTLTGFFAARDAGVHVKKKWLADDNACPICIANEDEGAIELEEMFPSGDIAPCAHPFCECVLSPEVTDEKDEQG